MVLKAELENVCKVTIPETDTQQELNIHLLLAVVTTLFIHYRNTDYASLIPNTPSIHALH